MLELKENKQGGDAAYLTTLDIIKKGNIITFHFVAHHSQCFSYSDQYNDPIYNGDVTEIFLYYGKKNHYYEIEVAPNGTVFFADIENIDHQTSICFLPKTGLETEVNKTEDGYESWIHLDLEVLKVNQKGILFNAFRVETDGGVTNRHLFSLNPTLSGSFHRMEYFIPLP